eukprot:scaffold203125_cov42-Prasinocladus_malaysianus.AAC.2
MCESAAKACKEQSPEECASDAFDHVKPAVEAQKPSKLNADNAPHVRVAHVYWIGQSEVVGDPVSPVLCCDFAVPRGTACAVGGHFPVQHGTSWGLKRDTPLNVWEADGNSGGKKAPKAVASRDPGV